MSRRWSGGWAAAARTARLVLVFALVSLVLFVSIGVGILRTVSKEFVKREESAARLQAQFVARSLVQWESVFGQDPDPLLSFARTQLLRPPIEHIKVWTADGTVIFSDVRGLIGRRFATGRLLQQAFSKGATAGEVTSPSDASSVAGRGSSSKFYATYVPVSAYGAPAAAKPLAVVEVYQDYASIATPAGQLDRSVFGVLSVGLAILWVLLLPVMYRISNRLARQNAQLLEAESRGRAMQAERASLLHRTVQATEQERRRVALELHDGPVQHLSALDLILEGVTLSMSPEEQSKTGSPVRKVQLRLREEIAGLRRIMSELRPPALDERGLEAALRDHLNSVQSRDGVLCTVESNLTERLDPAREIVLYRVAQEALTNVVKHAHASHAWISVREVNRHVELEIRDDGRGFDASRLGDLAKNGHFGLVGMRERVEVAGGRWEIRAAAGGGTTVRAVLPRDALNG